MTIGVILLIGVLNTLGSKTSGAIQTVSTVCKLIPLVLIIVFGFIKGGGNNPIVHPLVAEAFKSNGCNRTIISCYIIRLRWMDKRWCYSW